jgi:hypothetical protein
MKSEILLLAKRGYFVGLIYVENDYVISIVVFQYYLSAVNCNLFHGRAR